MHHAPRVVAIVLMLGSAFPVWGQAKNLLESRCPDCKIDLMVRSPVHAFDCPASAENQINGQLAELERERASGRISSEAYHARRRALNDAWYAARESRRRAEQAAREQEQQARERARKDDSELAAKIDAGKRKIRDAGNLQSYPPEVLTAKARELRQKANEAAAAGMTSTSNAMRSLARAFEDAAAGAYMATPQSDEDRLSWGTDDEVTTGRDFEQEPLLLGDPIDAALYTNDLRAKLFDGILGAPPLSDAPSPLEALDNRIIDHAPTALGAAGEALNAAAGLSVVRDSVIDNIISQLPAYFEGQLNRLDEQVEEQQILRSLGQSGPSWSPASPSRLRDLTESPQRVPPASNGSGPSLVNRLRDLWGDSAPRTVEPPAPAPQTPKSLRNLLDQ